MRDKKVLEFINHQQGNMSVKEYEQLKFFSQNGSNVLVPKSKNDGVSNPKLQGGGSS